MNLGKLAGLDKCFSKKIDVWSSTREFVEALVSPATFDAYMAKFSKYQILNNDMQKWPIAMEIFWTHP